MIRLGFSVFLSFHSLSLSFGLGYKNPIVYRRARGRGRDIALERERENMETLTKRKGQREERTKYGKC